MKHKTPESEVVIEMRGRRVFDSPPPGTIPVAGPFRPMTEDWMLFRTMNDLVAGHIDFVLVKERARKDIGDYVGVSIWRTGVVMIQVEKETGRPRSKANGESGVQSDATTT